MDRFNSLFERFTLRYQILQIEAWNHMTGSEFWRRQAFYIFLDLYSIGGIFRILAILFFNSEMNDRWLNIDPIFYTVASRFLFGDPMAVSGYCCMVTFLPIINSYFRYGFPVHFRLLLDDLERFYSHGILENQLRSNPYLHEGQRRKFLKVYRFVEKVTFRVNLLLAFGIFSLLPVFTYWIWAETTLWWTFLELTIELSICLLITYLTLSHGTIGLSIAVMSSLGYRWSLFTDRKQLSRELGNYRKLMDNRLKQLSLYIRLGSSHRKHVDIKHRAIESVGGAVNVALTYGLSFNQLSNVTYILTLYFRPEVPFSGKLFLCGVIFAQMVLMFTATWLVIRLNDALYCIATPLSAAPVVLTSGNIVLNIFYEMIITKRRFRFRLGALGAITKRSIVSFLMLYSSMIMFLVPIFRI